VQAAIEQNHDKDGMIWPISLAPFEVLICLIDIEGCGNERFGGRNIPWP